MKKNALASLVLLLASSLSHADGSALLQRCHTAEVGLAEANESQRTAIAYCYGLLQGVRELNALYEKQHPNAAYFCLGEHALSHAEAAALVVQYLQQNPPAQRQNATVAAVRALRDRYPCR